MTDKRIVEKVRRFSDRALSRLWGTVVGVRTEQPVVALTFDDGPDPRFTPALADLLERHNARATFFMVGKNAARHPDVVERLAAAGHCIANHSWDHPSFVGLSSPQRRSQIRRCTRALGPRASFLFRPPFGHQNLASRIDAWLCGHEVVTWTVLAEDWADRPSSFLVEQVAGRIRPGAIVLLHDGLYARLDKDFADRSATLEAVGRLLERFASTYRFVTVPDLLAAGRPIHVMWRRRPDPAWLARLETAEGKAAWRTKPAAPM